MSNKIQQEISAKGKLEGAAIIRDHRTALNKMALVRKPAIKLAAKADQSGGSHIYTGGGQPEGFGSEFVWDRKDNQALLVLFINCADQYGVSIDGLKAGDTVEVTSAAGIGSFKTEHGNKTISSILGLVATGADIAATAGGYPEALPLIDAAADFAKDQFKDTNEHSKRRDAFGQDPATGEFGRQEGGILVCMPAANGVYYSADGDHKNRWLKDTKERTSHNLPDHIPGDCAFFLNRRAETNKMRSIKDGQAYIVGWDWKFEDNAGYYKLFVRLTKGALPHPPIL